MVEILSHLHHRFHQHLDELGMDLWVRQMHTVATSMGQQRAGKLLGQEEACQIPAVCCLLLRHSRFRLGVPPLADPHGRNDAAPRKAWCRRSNELGCHCRNMRHRESCPGGQHDESRHHLRARRPYDLDFDRTCRLNHGSVYPGLVCGLPHHQVYHFLMSDTV
ncbi:hypothetical protein CaCOL14_000048 [Colletotrichum acutatum]